MSRPSYQPVATAGANEAAHRTQIAEALNRILAGGINCTTTITLTANATTTTFKDPRIGGFSYIAFMPTTANASTAEKAGIWISAQQKGQCTINHASSANTDQNFTVSILG